MDLKRSDLVLLSAFVIIQFAALALVTQFPQQVQAFEDPGDPGNSLLYFVLFMAVTFSMLVVIIFRLMLVLRIVMLGAIVGGASLSFGLLIHIIITPAWLVLISSVFLAILLVTATLISKDPRLKSFTAGVLCVGAIVILGTSLGPVPALFLLVVLSLYDYWAVRKTGHMQTIADGLVEADLPLLLRHVDTDGAETTIGLGDVALPGMLAASVMYHLSSTTGNIPGPNALVAVMVVFGGAVGLALLLSKLDDAPAPGLPWINGGAILALAISYPLFFIL